MDMDCRTDSKDTRHMDIGSNTRSKDSRRLGRPSHYCSVDSSKRPNKAVVVRRLDMGIFPSAFRSQSSKVSHSNLSRSRRVFYPFRKARMGNWAGCWTPRDTKEEDSWWEEAGRWKERGIILGSEWNMDWLSCSR
jgi:hypothetical protein